MIIAFLLAFVACSGGKHQQVPTTYTASGVLPLVVGQHWTMRDQNGNESWFEILERPKYQGCESGTFIDMHITKSATDAYWAYGWPGADEHFILTWKDGTWRSVTNFSTTTGKDGKPYPGTAQPSPVTGKPLPYYLMPPNMAIRAGQQLDIRTEYQNLVYQGGDRSACLKPSEVNRPITIVSWVTRTAVEQVNTPVYTGPAVATRFCEYTGPTCPDNSPVNAEVWRFAPGIGLVEITRVLPSGVTLDTKRIGLE